MPGLLDILKGKKQKQDASKKASKIYKEGDLEKSTILQRLKKADDAKKRIRESYKKQNKKLKESK